MIGETNNTEAWAGADRTVRRELGEEKRGKAALEALEADRARQAAEKAELVAQADKEFWDIVHNTTRETEDHL